MDNPELDKLLRGIVRTATVNLALQFHRSRKKLGLSDERLLFALTRPRCRSKNDFMQNAHACMKTLRRIWPRLEPVEILELTQVIVLASSLSLQHALSRRDVLAFVSPWRRNTARPNDIRG